MGGRPYILRMGLKQPAADPVRVEPLRVPQPSREPNPVPAPDRVPEPSPAIVPDRERELQPA